MPNRAQFNRYNNNSNSVGTFPTVERIGMALLNAPLVNFQKVDFIFYISELRAYFFNGEENFFKMAGPIDLLKYICQKMMEGIRFLIIISIF